MNILAFDTCFNKTYIVLKSENKILSYEKISSDDKNYHSAYLIPKIRDILVQNKMLIKDIDAIGVNIGPGSFTGIRAGITIARVLSQQFNTKLVGVTSLEILSKLNNSKNAIVALDARKNKVYFAAYTNNKECIKPCLIDRGELLLKISADDVPVVDKSLSEYFIENNVKHICYEDNDENIVLYLLELVELKLQENKYDYNWAKVKPLYIQKPSITLPKVVINE